MGRDRWALGLDLAVKGALIGLLVFALARPDLPQFTARRCSPGAHCPLAAFIVPAWWLLRGHRSGATCPYALDILLVLPFLIDVAGRNGALAL